MTDKNLVSRFAGEQLVFRRHSIYSFLTAHKAIDGERSPDPPHLLGVAAIAKAMACPVSTTYMPRQGGMLYNPLQCSSDLHRTHWLWCSLWVAQPYALTEKMPVEPLKT